MSPAHLHQYAASLVSPGQLSESLPASQVCYRFIWLQLDHIDLVIHKSWRRVQFLRRVIKKEYLFPR